MVAADSTASPVRVKRRRGGRNARRRNKRNRVRRRSTWLVKRGRIELAPCVVCGTEQNLTIHHIEPLEPGRFVFLCEECHVLAHKPVFRMIRVCIASGHFSIRPEAILPLKEVPGD